MKRISQILLFILISTLALSVFATDKPADVKTNAPTAKERNSEEVEKVKEEGKAKEKVMFELGAILPIALAVSFGALAMGIVGGMAVAGIARNPGAKAQVQSVMVLAIVFIESLAIYALLVFFMYFAKT